MLLGLIIAAALTTLYLCDGTLLIVFDAFHCIYDRVHPTPPVELIDHG